MSLRYYKRMHLARGIALNFSRSGPSLTVGVPGAHLTLGARGKTITLGGCGSGLYYTKHEGWHDPADHNQHDHLASYPALIIGALTAAAALAAICC